MNRINLVLLMLLFVFPRIYGGSPFERKVTPKEKSVIGTVVEIKSQEKADKKPERSNLWFDTPCGGSNVYDRPTTKKPQLDVSYSSGDNDPCFP